MADTAADDISPKRILLLDDEAALRAVLAETLRGEGYVVDEAGDGAEGLRRLRDARPDLVLLDMAMPVLDGQGFIEQCRSEPNGEGVPLVIVSATPSVPESPQEFGVKAVLVKPFDLGVLLAMVERIVHAASNDG